MSLGQIEDPGAASLPTTAVTINLTGFELNPYALALLTLTIRYLHARRRLVPGF